MAGTISVTGKTYGEPGEEESAEAMDVALLGDGETFWDVDHGDQTAKPVSWERRAHARFSPLLSMTSTADPSNNTPVP